MKVIKNEQGPFKMETVNGKVFDYPGNFTEDWENDTFNEKAIKEAFNEEVNYFFNLPSTKKAIEDYKKIFFELITKKLEEKINADFIKEEYYFDHFSEGIETYYDTGGDFQESIVNTFENIIDYELYQEVLDTL